MPVAWLVPISRGCLVLALASLVAFPLAAGPARTQQASKHFAETNQSIAGRFMRYWEGHGALPQQGFPISPEFREKSDLNGKSYTVQYFERAVFEYHPEYAGTPNQVLLSQLGTFMLKSRYGGTAPSTGVLKINTVHNPTKDEGPKEYVELINTGTAAQDLAGWAIRTSSSRVPPFKFPAGAQLAPGATLRVVSGLKATASGPDEYLWRSAYTWCNEGDAATLLDPEGTVADRLFYGKPVDLGSGKTACAK